MRMVSCRIWGVLAVFLVGLGGLPLYGQSAGERAFPFLSIARTPHTLALGGKSVVNTTPLVSALNDQNPASLNYLHHGYAHLAYAFHLGGSHLQQAEYAHHVGSVGTFALGFTQLHYGRMTARDEHANVVGTFAAYDLALSLQWARELSTGLHVGVSLQPIMGHIAGYNAFGLSVDVGLYYHSPDWRLQAGAVYRNAGAMLRPYSPVPIVATPHELLLGVSYQLKHAPVRFVMTLQEMSNLRTRYQPERAYTGYIANLTPAPEAEKIGWAILAEALAHPIFAFEVQAHPILNLTVSYNLRRQSELRRTDKAWLEGLAAGFSILYKRFTLEYACAFYHRSAITHQVLVAWRFLEPFERSVRLTSPNSSFSE